MIAQVLFAQKLSTISLIKVTIYILCDIYHIVIDIIKLLKAELSEMDVNNYKTDWIGPYLREFANKKGIPFAALMKTLRNILGGVKVCTL